MADYDDTDDLLDEETDALLADETDAEKKKKKKGGKTEGDAVGQTEVAVSENFYAYMTGIGAPASLIASVLKNWRHLRGEGLRRALADFARRVTSRATAHVQVDIDKNKDYGLVHNIIQYFKSVASGPDQRQRMDNRNRFDPK